MTAQTPTPDNTRRDTLIRLTEGETAQLIRASNGRSVPMSFGPGFCALQAEKAPWAVVLLNEWRGKTFSNGAGI